MEEFVDSNLHGDFLGGNKPLMIDIHVFAMLDRIMLLENSLWHAAFEEMKIRDQCPQMTAYVERFRQSELKDACPVPGHFHKLIEAYEQVEPGEKAALNVEWLN